ncbi:hypothetical protein EI94DRAFT_1578784, partial [Lactarius quietus]
AFTVHTFAVVIVLIDSYFWDHWPIWPEFFSIYFNVYEGKSSDYCAISLPCHVSPFWTYITSLPRLVLATALFISIGFIRDGHIRSLVQPTIFYIFLMSFLAHKEWRSVVYVFSQLNITTSHDVQTMHVFSSSPLLCTGAGEEFGAVGALVLNTAATVLFMRASMANYPGGTALALLNERYADSPW